MLVRSLTASDTAAYIALRREMLDDSPWAFSSSPQDDQGLNPAFIAERLAQPGQAIVGAFDGAGRLVGSAGLRRHTSLKMAHRAHVWGVYVTPAARSRGTATKIFAHLFEVARSWHGVTSLGLSASVRSEAARLLYERLGFVAWGREPGAIVIDGEACDEIHMVKFLDAKSEHAAVPVLIA